MRSTLTIAGREFRSYFYSPLAYVVICVGLIVLGLFFFAGPGAFWQADRASCDRLFQYVSWGLCLFIVPVITMRLLAEEKRSGTLEMLITLPVRDAEVILGKFFGAFGFVMVLLAGTAIYPLAMFGWPWNLGALDPGPVFAGYLGLVLFSAAAISIGLMISSLTESQALAFILTLFTLLVMQNVSRIGSFAPGVFGEFLRSVSFDTNTQQFGRGLIDSRNVIYFLSITGLCLVIAFRSLESRKLS
ncbi:MAG: ABC transporter permease [Polyangiaceae bacterium]|nr:ABC transporter permease [Polyangiaceae bacterium]